MKFALIAAVVALAQGVKLRDEDDEAEAEDSANVATESENVSSTGVAINVLQAGTGAQCQSGQNASVQYTGALKSNG